MLTKYSAGLLQPQDQGWAGSPSPEPPAPREPQGGCPWHRGQPGLLHPSAFRPGMDTRWGPEGRGEPRSRVHPPLLPALCQPLADAHRPHILSSRAGGCSRQLGGTGTRQRVMLPQPAPPSFLGGRGASRGPRCSAPQARISPPWSSIPAAAGSSAACLRPWPPTSGCPGNWAPSLPRKPQALAGWELWTLVTAGGRRGQPDQPSVSQHPERPGQLLPGGSTDPNTGSQS